MEHTFGIVEKLGSSFNKEKNANLFKDIVEFKGEYFILLTTCNRKEDILNLGDIIEDHKWKIAKLTRCISDNVFQIIEVEDFKK